MNKRGGWGVCWPKQGSRVGAGRTCIVVIVVIVVIASPRVIVIALPGVVRVGVLLVLCLLVVIVVLPRVCGAAILLVLILQQFARVESRECDKQHCQPQQKVAPEHGGGRRWWMRAMAEKKSKVWE